MSGDDKSQLDNAKRVLAQVMGYYNREMMDFESALWLQMMSDFGGAAVVNFLIKHVETSVFAPKAAEARLALAPGAGNALAAYEDLRRLVAEVGPYASPQFEDSAMAGAVMQLGGWAKVGEDFPDHTERFAYEAYFKRFELAYKQSCSDWMRGVGYSKPLIGIHEIENKATQLRLTQQAELRQLPMRTAE